MFRCSADAPERLPLVDGDMVGFQALDDVLRIGFGGVVRVALESDVGDDLSHDSASNPSGLRVPFDTITAFERFRHASALAARGETAAGPSTFATAC